MLCGWVTCKNGHSVDCADCFAVIYFCKEVGELYLAIQNSTDPVSLPRYSLPRHQTLNFLFVNFCL